MDISDYVIDITLIAIVIRQVREARLDAMTVLLPLGICAWVCSHYLTGIPTGGNNLVLIGLLTLVGVGCGVLSGLTTRVRHHDGHVMIKAGAVAAGTWVASMGARFAFALWAAHGGGDDLVRFSTNHGIDSADAWTAALVLMAMGEVFVRTGILVARGVRVARTAQATPADRVLA